MKFKSLFFLLLAVTLSGCESTTETQENYLCPTASIVKNAQHMYRFDPKDTPTHDKLAFRGDITYINGRCFYEGNQLMLDLDMVYKLTEGLHQYKKPFKVDYFVALADAQNNIIKKQVYTENLQFEEHERVIENEKNIEFPITRTGSGETGSYRIYVGFQMDKKDWENSTKWLSNP